MFKKIMSTTGILILIAVAVMGLWTFVDRHGRDELVPKNQASDSDDVAKKAAEPAFDKTQYSTDKPESVWVVVNKKRQLEPLTYAPTDLVAVGNNQQLRKEAATALANMIAAAKSNGLTIAPLSGYRSYDTQVTVYNNEVKTNGQAVADSQSAKPGHSEHQTGWAIDVGGGGCNIDECFGNTTEGKWVAKHAYEYGFIVRYTADKQAITGYRAEPWHLRYIGPVLSGEMNRTSTTTLEEFFDL